MHTKAPALGRKTGPEGHSAFKQQNTKLNARPQTELLFSGSHWGDAHILGVGCRRQSSRARPANAGKAATCPSLSSPSTARGGRVLSGWGPTQHTQGRLRDAGTGSPRNPTHWWHRAAVSYKRVRARGSDRSAPSSGWAKVPRAASDRLRGPPASRLAQEEPCGHTLGTAHERGGCGQNEPREQSLPVPGLSHRSDSRLASRHRSGAATDPPARLSAGTGRGRRGQAGLREARGDGAGAGRGSDS